MQMGIPFRIADFQAVDDHFIGAREVGEERDHGWRRFFSDFADVVADRLGIVYDDIPALCDRIQEARVQRVRGLCVLSLIGELLRYLPVILDTVALEFRD